MKIKLVVLLWAFDDYMLPCINKKLFGIPCPGCGLQRSIEHLINGNFVGAFIMYPAIYTLIPLGLIFVLNKFFQFKHYNLLVVTLSLSSVALILINYFIKLLH